MKFILLVLVVFVNGTANNAAFVTDSAVSCEKAKAKMVEDVLKHNEQNENKVAYTVMACAEPKLAPHGTDV